MTWMLPVLLFGSHVSVKDGLDDITILHEMTSSLSIALGVLSTTLDNVISCCAASRRP